MCIDNSSNRFRYPSLLSNDFSDVFFMNLQPVCYAFFFLNALDRNVLRKVNKGFNDCFNQLFHFNYLPYFSLWNFSKIPCWENRFRTVSEGLAPFFNHLRASSSSIFTLAG